MDVVQQYLVAQKELADMQEHVRKKKQQLKTSEELLQRFLQTCPDREYKLDFGEQPHEQYGESGVLKLVSKQKQVSLSKKFVHDRIESFCTQHFSTQTKENCKLFADKCTKSIFAVDASVQTTNIVRQKLKKRKHVTSTSS